MQIFDERYKEVVDRVCKYDMDNFLKSVMVLEELDSMEDLDYGTMVKAIFEVCGLEERK